VSKGVVTLDQSLIWKRIAGVGPRRSYHATPQFSGIGLQRADRAGRSFAPIEFPRWNASRAGRATRAARGDGIGVRDRAAGRAKRVLFIYEQGGVSHIDTWDPKPLAPSDHRSPFAPISTNVPGLQFTSLLSKTAQVADKLTVVRSLYHKGGGGQRASRWNAVRVVRRGARRSVGDA
jgi:hypothetical protein